MKIQRYKGMATALQRLLGLRICCAYRTVSAAAVSVISGMVPIHLVVEERRSLRMREARNKTEARERALLTWQHEWEQTTEAR